MSSEICRATPLRPVQESCHLPERTGVDWANTAGAPIADPSTRTSEPEDMTERSERDMREPRSYQKEWRPICAAASHRYGRGGRIPLPPAAKGGRGRSPVPPSKGDAQ